VADAAREAGVTYCVEPLARNQTAFVNTVQEAADIVRQIDSPHLRTMMTARRRDRPRLSRSTC